MAHSQLSPCCLRTFATALTSALLNEVTFVLLVMPPCWDSPDSFCSFSSSLSSHSSSASSSSSSSGKPCVSWARKSSSVCARTTITTSLPLNDSYLFLFSPEMLYHSSSSAFSCTTSTSLLIKLSSLWHQAHTEQLVHYTCTRPLCCNLFKNIS